MLERSPVTARLLLVGLLPGETCTVSNVVPPEVRLLGVAVPVPEGGVEAEVTPKEMEALPLRDCASDIVTGIVLVPVAVFAATVAWNEKMLSPAVTSPWVPSSKKACEARPIE